VSNQASIESSIIFDRTAIAKGEGVKLPGEQLELGMSLIEKMSSADFEPERYAEYRERALAMIEKKVEGQEIKAVAPAPRRSGQVVDIFAALKKRRPPPEKTQGLEATSILYDS